MLNKHIEQQLIHRINTQLNTDFIILLGPFAKGTAREESDIDFAYFSNQKLPSYERFTLAADLATIVSRKSENAWYATLIEQRASILKAIKE